jgi:hypothetical protein
MNIVMSRAATVSLKDKERIEGDLRGDAPGAGKLLFRGRKGGAGGKAYAE